MSFLIYIFYININLIYSYIKYKGFWEAIKLENGNFLFLSENGLYTLDPTFQILNYTDKVELNNISYTTIKQFKREDGSNILIITKSNHYILNSDGNLLYTKIINGSLDKFQSSVIPYSHSRNVFSYYIINNDKPNIIFRKYSYNSTDEYFEIRDFNLINASEIYNNYITCQLMKNINENVISCFFPTIINDEYYINCTVFKAEENFEIIKTSQLKIEGKIKTGLKSEVMSTDDRKKVLLIFYINYGTILFYAGYDINNNSFTYANQISGDYCCPSIFTSDISYCKETEEFIVSFFTYSSLDECPNVYFIYSFDKKFEYSFLGILGNFILGDSIPFTIYDNTYFTQKIFFSSIAQKYCIILNLNSSNILSLFIINKDINITNPTELKSSDSPPKFICENYSDNFKILLEENFIEKCSSEINYMISNFSWYKFTINYKAFEFSFNCSKKYPYEIVETHKCVEYCDESSLLNGACILNYNKSNYINIRENTTDINIYEVFINQSDSISHELISYQSDNISQEVISYQSDSILHKLISYQSDSISHKLISYQSDSISHKLISYQSDSISQEVINHQSDSISIEIKNKDIKTYLLDSITEVKKIESDKSIISDTNLISKSTNFISDSQKINKLITNNIIITDNIGTEEEIKDLLNEILNKKKDSNKNFIENIQNILQNIFSDDSFKNILDSIVNAEKDITIINNETIIQITSTENQKNNKNHNISTIKLGACEETLKKAYKIDRDKSLLILKIDFFIDGLKIPVIQYEVYHPDNKSKLNLTLCHNNIEINIPVLVDENNLYMYEQDSDYYNDRCNTSANGKDTPLEYRRKEFINNNMSLCEPDCNYIGYDYDTKNSKCECKIKKEMSIFNIKIDTERLYNKFTGLTSSNIDIIKCYYLLYKKENLIYNIGFYIILFIIFLFCIGALTFVFKGYDLLVQKINIIISITKKTNKIKDTPSIITKNTNKKYKPKKRGKRKKNLKKQNNPPIKKVKNKNTKKRNNKLNLTNETKSILKLKSKNNESLIKNINKKKTKNSKYIKKAKKLKKINKSKLVTDVPDSKMKSLNNSKRYLNDYELNRMQYNDAIKYDRRNYMQYYWSLLKIGNLFLFSFMPNNDYNSMVIKICLFFFSFGLYYTVNALFFTDSTMNKIYEDNGEYDFIYQIPKILYSNLICTVINLIVRLLSLSEKEILKIKKMRKNENLKQKVEQLKKCLKIKFVFYYLISFLFLFIFWFYVSCFCAVYKNTQIYLIKDTLISFSLSLLYPLGYYIIPGLFRLLALKNKNNECIYKISFFLQSF